jgi:ribosomal protein S18 acetylase RimI-like enzyme
MNDSCDQIEFRRPAPDLAQPLAAFFAALVAAGDDRLFHPHPFTAEVALERTRYAGKDVYCVAVAANRVLGYGMLRGWDEGFEIPSLGIVVRSESRRLGLGRALMEYLHGEARRRGASRVRLKAYPENAAALAMYRTLGYEFGETEGQQVLGFKTL